MVDSAEPPIGSPYPPGPLRSFPRWAALALVLLLFVPWGALAADRGLTLQPDPSPAPSRTTPLYSGRNALVIGCDGYASAWAPLGRAVRDAEEVAEALQGLGFATEVLRNPDATELRDAFSSLAGGPGRDPERAIFVFFAGHGHTLTRADGTRLGYIVPVDAPAPEKDLPGFLSRAVSMREVEEISTLIQAKHVLMVFDSCFSGSVFRGSPRTPSRYILDQVDRPVRAFIASGDETESVPDESVFQACMVQGLADRYADANQDGFVTGEELGLYLEETVVEYTNGSQHPYYGKINNPGLDKGNFVFELDVPPARSRTPEPAPRPAPTGTRPPSLETPPSRLPDQPSIAVLPFQAPGRDAAGTSVAEGITDNLILALSRMPGMFVISRGSTFAYQGEKVRPDDAAGELGVRYALEGSVLRSGDRLRISVHLFDALSHRHVWSERYDKRTDDLFRVLDEITQSIAVSLHVRLTHGEQFRTWQTDRFEAWRYAARAFGLFEQFNRADNHRARENIRKALEIDPDYAYARTLLAWTHLIDARAGYTDNPLASLMEAQRLSRKVAAAGHAIPEQHALEAYIQLALRRHDRAVAEGRRAVELGPSVAVNHVVLSQVLHYAGRSAEAVARAQQAMRLSPYHPGYYLFTLGLAYHGAGLYRDALRAFSVLLDRAQQGAFPRDVAHLCLAATQAFLNRPARAASHVDEALALNPSLSLDYIRRFSFYKNPAQLDTLTTSLRKAGLE